MSNLLIKNDRAFIDTYECSVTFGKNGFATDKLEGDGKTPIGAFPLGRIYYRADRVERPKTHLECIEITPEMGWCDDASSPHYNTFVKLPFDGSHEQLWRQDHVYDIVVDVKYNQNPAIPGKGSAIFIHLKGETPTAGCLAFDYTDLMAILERLTPTSQVWIEAP